MLKALIKATNEYRVETKEDAQAMHDEMNERAEKENFQLTAWKETVKERKSGGEVVESYVQVIYTIVFNELKDPERFGGDATYDFKTPAATELPWEE